KELKKYLLIASEFPQHPLRIPTYKMVKLFIVVKIHQHRRLTRKYNRKVSKIFTGISLFFLLTIHFPASNGINLKCFLPTFLEFSQDFLQFSQKLQIFQRRRKRN